MAVFYCVSFMVRFAHIPSLSCLLAANRPFGATLFDAGAVVVPADQLGRGRGTQLGLCRYLLP
jgi:hypothetical protein